MRPRRRHLLAGRTRNHRLLPGRIPGRALPPPRRQRQARPTLPLKCQARPAQCLLDCSVRCWQRPMRLPFWLPRRSRRTQRLWPRKVNPNLVLIRQSRRGRRCQPLPSIRPRIPGAWENRKQSFFDGFAFYRVASEVDLRMMRQPELVSREAQTLSRDGSARASSNLFSLLGLPGRFADPLLPTAKSPEIILSERLWKTQFGADPRVSRQSLFVSARAIGAHRRRRSRRYPCAAGKRGRLGVDQ